MNKNYSSYNSNISGWRCENCGSINRSDAKFCRDCGAPKPVNSTPHVSDPQDKPYIAEMPQKKTSPAIMIAIAVVITLILALATFFVVKMIVEKKAQGDPAPSQEQSQSIDNDADLEDDYDSNDDQGAVAGEDEDPYYKVGDSYYVQDVIMVRYGPGKQYDQMLRDELASDEYAASVDYKDDPEPASLKKGSKIVCRGMSEDGKWMALTEGWVCVYDNGEWLVR